MGLFVPKPPSAKFRSVGTDGISACVGEREEYLHDVWEWARRRGDLLRLQIMRDYRECRKENGPTFRRHQDWLLSNWNDPAFWVEWEIRFSRLRTERTIESWAAN